MYTLPPRTTPRLGTPRIRCVGFSLSRATKHTVRRRRSIRMGLSNFPSPAEGVLPVLVMNTVLSVALLKSAVRSVLQVLGIIAYSPPRPLPGAHASYDGGCEKAAVGRRIWTTRFKHLFAAAGDDPSGGSHRGGECCVCLCGFEDEEEVSELSCKHFFHKGCLEKWFLNRHTTCPLCRSFL